MLRTDAKSPIGYFTVPEYACAVSRRLNALQDFFLGYFHPDWELDSPSRSAVVEKYLRAADPAEARAVADDLRELLNRRLGEEQLHDLALRDYSLFFDPWLNEISMREWLQGLLRELERGLQPLDLAPPDGA